MCTDPRRDPATIVVVADVADLWALERANATNGRYHVLGATLSPLDGVGPQDLTIDALVARAHEEDADGLFATCIQHEIDHLNGVLFVDYLSKLKRDRVLKKFTKIAKRAGE